MHNHLFTLWSSKLFCILMSSTPDSVTIRLLNLIFIELRSFNGDNFFVFKFSKIYLAVKLLRATSTSFEEFKLGMFICFGCD